jgi:hypothetical protein
MAVFRRAVLLVLLLTVPFQAALGATGLLCAAGAHHTHDGVSTPHSHDSATVSEHDQESTASSDHHDSAAQPGPHEPHDAAGKCKICNECCSTTAPITAVQQNVFPPDTPSRVSSIVEPDIVSRAGDGPFRPPRVTAA